MFSPSEQHDWLADIKQTASHAGEAFRSQADQKYRVAKIHGLIALLFGVAVLLCSSSYAGMLVGGCFFAAFSVEDIRSGRSLTRKSFEQKRLSHMASDELLGFIQARNSPEGVEKRALEQIGRIKKSMINSDLSMFLQVAAVLILLFHSSGFLGFMAALIFSVSAIFCAYKLWHKGEDLSTWEHALVSNKVLLLEMVEQVECEAANSVPLLQDQNDLFSDAVNVRPE